MGVLLPSVGVLLPSVGDTLLGVAVVLLGVPVPVVPVVFPGAPMMFPGVSCPAGAAETGGLTPGASWMMQAGSVLATSRSRHAGLRSYGEPPRTVGCWGTGVWAAALAQNAPSTITYVMDLSVICQMRDFSSHTPIRVSKTASPPPMEL